MSRAASQRAYRQRQRNGVACGTVAYDERTIFALHRAGILSEREIERLTNDRAALRHRINEALTAALDRWTEALAEPFLQPRKKPLRVTPPRRRKA